MSREQRETLFAWAALAAGAVAWFVSQQAGSDLSFAHCARSGLVPVVIIGFLALVLAGAGGLLSWRIWSRSRALELAHPFIALVGTLTAGLLAIAIVYQTMASLIIPSCFG